MGSTAIYPHWEPRECLTVERVRWISYCDFTTYPVKTWGFSLGLILQTSWEWKADLLAQSADGRMNVSYYLYFPYVDILRRHPMSIA
ncbi:hypothetical protein KSC_107920 [Ktedonobacter sp. SOSP1-52]|nr:hypothetical protein KSC_107920 [Ktedonobacter sp. SOSP1-52]